MDPFSLLVMSSCGSLYVATKSRHSCQSQAHTRLFECDGSPLSSTQSANNSRVKNPSRDHSPNLRDLGDCDSGHVCHSPQHPSSPVYGSNFGDTSTGDRCSVSGLAGAVDVHVFTVPLAQKSRSETTCQQGGRGDSNSPLVAITTVDPTPTACGSSLLFSIPPRSTVTTGDHLRWKVIPSACMEALMQHF